MTHVIQPVNLSSLLADRVWVMPDRQRKEDVFKKLVQSICQTDNALVESEVLNLVLQREKSMGTTLETGMSVPHARVEGLEKAVGALAILPQGVTGGEKPAIEAVLLFVSPSRAEYFQNHLQILALVAQTFTPQYLRELCRCKTAEQARALLTNQK